MLYVTACYFQSHEILTAFAPLQMHKKAAKIIHLISTTSYPIHNFISYPQLHIYPHILSIS
ncbi:hypothetical protein CY34DRAFT_800369 [Suillus luteus UH-Slu-Lm8-n1]|uniref:Uncharacterized protein n=1 Tax=Suillus luteus UH-Slu-Lm8-n1 TaxID=930992 RepID=A0A0D0BKP6_9AGAM|nr:hypothetical protein CY34DRAFT_800369 [Suillus luteus UH-Slu-Lm8-n1]